MRRAPGQFNNWVIGLLVQIIGFPLKITGTMTADRTQTARDASGNLCLDSVDNGFTVSQSIDRGTGALPASVNATNQCLTLANVDAATCNIESFGFGTTGANIRARISGGTRSVPTAVTDGQIFFNLPNGGYDGTAWQIDSIGYRTVADGLWSGANRGAYHQWTGTPNGSTTAAEWMRLQNGNLCVGVTHTAGNGLVQRASGTTRANGDAWGTDTFLWRDAASSLITEGAFRSNSSTGGIGYAAGAGGTVTQITSRTTGVTLNKITGAITLVSAAGSAAWQSFTVTNSAVAATDTIICNQVSGTDLNMLHVTAISAGSFRISFATTGGTTVEQPVLRFTVIKSVSA